VKEGNDPLGVKSPFFSRDGVFRCDFNKKGVTAMKKIVFLSLVGLLLATMAWGQERVETPVFNIGSKWTSKADNGWELTSELVGEEKDAYIFSTVFPGGREKGEWKFFYSKKNMNCVKVIRDGKQDKYFRDVLRKSYDFPLYSGKKWSYNYRLFLPTGTPARDLDFLAELSVVGIEDVELPAGKFKAYKVRSDDTILIRSEQRAFFKDITGVSYYWYSPDAKVFPIKQVWEPSSFWKGSWWGSRFSQGCEYAKIELISFELK
jgi:hypothetical protein